MILKLKKYITFLVLFYTCSCSTYKYKIVGEWELVTIDDEILSLDQIKTTKIEEPTIEKYLKSGEYEVNYGDYNEKGRYKLNSDTLKYTANDIMFKINKLEKDLMILQYINHTSNNYIHYRRIK